MVSRGRPKLLFALVVLTIVGGAFAMRALMPGAAEPECQVGQALYNYKGWIGKTQDGGAPGPGRCDGDDHGYWGVTLGFDCKVRDQMGGVIGTVPPNRADGTCGIPGPGEPWPT